MLGQHVDPEDITETVVVVLCLENLAIMSSKKHHGSDDRFLKVKKDPRFWEMPEKERKIKIDKRFQSMFHDERFKLKYTVDKRGRPVNHTSTEDLKRFYNLSDSEQSDEEDGKKKKKKEQVKKKEKTKAKLDSAVGKDTDKSEKPVETGKNVKPKDCDFKGAQTVRGVKVFMEGEEDDDEEPGIDEDDEDLAKVDVGDSMSDASEDGDEDKVDEDELEAGSDLEGESEDESGLESDDDSDSGPDLARGKGNVETSSDEEDEVEAILRHEEEEIEHDWGELCKDAPRTEDVTKRLAVCNMDWDRMKAKDLLALFNSFKPKGGVVLSVKIYPSEFGKERIQTEQTQGPLELMALPEDPEKDTEEEKIYREKMRDYQFKRLKYYYAVVECDSLDTAAKIYEECDGFEYESSCSILDLRYIPDDMMFDDEPKDMATDVDLSVYTPKCFTSTASATSKVELTWDETDHERMTAMNRKFNKEELLQMDFNAYLASSSEEEDEEEGEGLIEMKVQEKELPKAEEQEAFVEEVREKPAKGKKKSAEQIGKYREMLKNIQDKNKKHQNKDMEMEITWVPGLKETTEQLVKKKLEGKDNMTPWEEFLEKKRDKKKLKTKNKQAAELDLSDDELPPDVDLDDPFFAEELGSVVDLKKKTKAKKNKKEERTPEEEEALVKRKAEMALLMDDEDDDKHKHFNYDKIVEDQNLSKIKRKRLLKKDTAQEEDNFQVDVQDPRFQAMFTSHLYNLDPSDPGYKKTKATQSILEEKQRRREQQQSCHQVALKSLESRKHEMGANKQEKADSSCSAVFDPSKKAIDPALSMLIKSIKNKTEQFQAKKKPKTT
ncbi:ESF1 homolog isoform X1 [Osmerus eperlanus]|uniref:ESF1 homolog isoform X1 n=1 Tax=Osmerus eperlanus TaxID=29151 RepID=UPI002E156C11